MVNSINPVNQALNILSVGKSQISEDRALSSTTDSPAQNDEVVLSSEAISIKEVQQATKTVSEELTAKPEQTLSGNLERLNALV